MDQYPDEHMQMALDAEQQWTKEMAQVSETLSATKFHDTSASVIADFEKLEAMNCAKNQAPLDMVAELKAINERLDVERQARISAEAKAAEAEIHQEKREHRNFWIAIISCAASVVAAIVGVLAFLNVHP